MTAADGCWLRGKSMIVILMVNCIAKAKGKMAGEFITDNLQKGRDKGEPHF